MSCSIKSAPSRASPTTRARMAAIFSALPPRFLSILRCKSFPLARRTRRSMLSNMTEFAVPACSTLTFYGTPRNCEAQKAQTLDGKPCRFCVLYGRHEQRRIIHAQKPVFHHHGAAEMRILEQHSRQQVACGARKTFGDPLSPAGFSESFLQQGRILREPRHGIVSIDR